MSKFGEMADQILEMLENGDKVDIESVKIRMLLSDTAVLNFMNEFGMIELKEGSVRITKSGLEFLN